MSVPVEVLRALAHDVGKYVARTARNLPEGAVPEVLVQMLVRDVFETADGVDALALFDRLAGEHAGALPEVRAELEALVAMRAALHAGESVRDAAARCLRVEALLRARLEEAS